MVGPPAKVMKLDSGSSSSIPIEHINPKNVLEMLAAEYSGSNSAARSSIINSTERQLVKKFVTEMRNLGQFFVSLCSDVLSDVLRFGTRHRLAKLERVGRRFHRIVGNFFYKAPFIHLDLELKYTSSVLKVAINGSRYSIKKAAIIELTKAPQFVHLNKVVLCYKSDGTIEEKCKIFVNYLHGIETILNNLNQIHFIFPISKSKKNLSSFSDHLQILNYLQKELLPVCGTPRSYKFELYFNYDFPRNTNGVDTCGANLIAQILQMRPIDRCSNVEIMLCGMYAPAMQLPIEAISDWLHQKSEGIAEKSQTRFLKIYSDRSETFRNEEELCDHLRETFEKAEVPSLSFHFEFYTYFLMEDQKLFNKKTNEAFWITKSRGIVRHHRYTVYTIKRFIVKKDEVGVISQKTLDA